MTTKQKAYIALIIGSLSIGLNPVLIKATGAPGTITSFYRFAFGSIALLIPFLISLKKSSSGLSKKGILIATIAGLSMAIDMSLWTTGIMLSNAAMPTLAGNMASIWVGLGAVIFFKEKQNKTFWFGLLIALTGIFLLVLHDFYSPNGIFKGLVLGMLAGIFYAAFMLLTQKGRTLLDTIPYLFIFTFTTSVFLAFFALALNIPFTGYSSYTWKLFIIMGVILHAGSWFLINFSQGNLPASLVSPTMLLQPVVAAIIAYLYLDESLTKNHIIGGCIVILGIYMVHFSKKR